MRYYVYALIDPTRNNTPFYIGKGIDNRLQSHFKAAEKIGAKNDAGVGVAELERVEAVGDGLGKKLPLGLWIAVAGHRLSSAQAPSLEAIA